MRRGKPILCYLHAGHSKNKQNMVSSSSYAAPVAVVLIAVTLLLPASWVVAQWRSGALTISARLLRRVRGIVLVLVVVVLFTASTIVLQLVFEAEHHRKPFLITYISFSMQALYLLGYRVRAAAAVGRLAQGWGAAQGGYAAVRHVGDEAGLEMAQACAPRRAIGSGGGAGGDAGAAGTGRPSEVPSEVGLVYVAWRLGGLILCANLLFNVSLQYTSVSSATVIASSSAVWTLLFSAWLLGEPLSLLRVASVSCGLAGVLLVVYGGAGEGAWGDDEHHHHPHAARALARISHSAAAAAHRAELKHALGSAGLVASAACYGAYTVRLKREVPSEKEAPLPYLFGLMGASLLAAGPPALLLLHATGVERLELPARDNLLAICGNALLGTVVANLLLARAALLTSPLVVVVGLSLSIPLAMASDVARQRERLTPALLAGAFAVWFAFLGVSVARVPKDGGLLGRVCAHCPTRCRHCAGLW